MKLLPPARSFAARLRDSYAASPRRARFAFLGVLALVVVLMSAKYADKISKLGDDGTQSRSAFLRWRGMINAAFAGENIYTGRNEYPNPPIMAILLKPFASLRPAVGALAWFYAKVLMAVLAAAWAFRLCGNLASGGREAPASEVGPPSRGGRVAAACSDANSVAVPLGSRHLPEVLPCAASPSSIRKAASAKPPRP